MEICNKWNLCHKKSKGCLNCFMFRRDAMNYKDSIIVTKTFTFDLLIRMKKYKYVKECNK